MRFFGYFAQFSAKTLLDWVRPPPLSAKKSKKISVFSVKEILDSTRSPPPLFGQCPKKTSFFRLIAPLSTPAGPQSDLSKIHSNACGNGIEHFDLDNLIDTCVHCIIAQFWRSVYKIALYKLQRVEAYSGIFNTIAQYMMWNLCMRYLDTEN